MLDVCRDRGDKFQRTWKMIHVFYPGKVPDSGRQRHSQIRSCKTNRASQCIGISCKLGITPNFGFHLKQRTSHNLYITGSPTYKYRSGDNKAMELTETFVTITHAIFYTPKPLALEIICASSLKCVRLFHCHCVL